MCGLSNIQAKLSSYISLRAGDEGYALVTSACRDHILEVSQVNYLQ